MSSLDDNILRVAYYYAHRFANRKFEIDELAAEGFIAGRKCRSSKLFQKRIRGAILDYINKELQHPTVSIDAAIFDFKVKDPKRFDFHPELPMYTDLSNRQLAQHALTILHMRYVEGMTYLEIAKRLGVSRQLVEREVQLSIKHLRKVLGENHGKKVTKADLPCSDG